MYTMQRNMKKTNSKNNTKPIQSNTAVPYMTNTVRKIAFGCINRTVIFY